MSLHPLAQEAYKEVSSHIPPNRLVDWSIALFDSIAELDAIARRQKRRRDAQDLVDSLDLPLVVGGIPLFKLSVGGMEWLENCPQKWWGASSACQDFRLIELSTVYAMAHRRKEDYLNLLSAFPAKIAVLTWAKQTKVAEDCLIMGASYLLPQNDPVARMIMGVPEASEDGPADLQTIGQIVAKQAGVSVFQALWEVSADSFWGFYCDYVDAKEDEYNAELREAKRNISLETFIGKQKVALIKARRELLKKSLAWLKGLDGQKAEGADQ